MPIEVFDDTRPPIGATFRVHCDGATHLSNPSTEGGIGFSVWCDDKLYRAYYSQLSGEVTNNVAELIAIQRALRWCHAHAMLTPHIVSDSALAIGLCDGSNKAKHPRIKMLTDYIFHVKQWMRPTFEAVLRTDQQQSFTDFLANLGIFGEGSHVKLAARRELLTAYDTWRRNTP